MEFYFYLAVGALAVVLAGLLLRQRKTEVGGFPEPGAFVPKELYQTIVAQQEMLRREVGEKEKELREAHAQIAAREEQVRHLEERLRLQSAESVELQSHFKKEFENIANRLLEEKSRRFTEQNADQLHQVLAPLRERIREFEAGIDRKFHEETRDRGALKREIEQLRDLNRQLSEDAHNLTSALKGQSKVQGDWGELQLEVLLEKAGLQRGTHFYTQTSFRHESGALKRPDFIIQLPDNKHLIVDAKVSLTAFERFYNAPDSTSREQHLKAHVAGLRNHVDNLSRTNYQTLYQLDTPDYLLMFVPIEGALLAATQADPRLFSDALERNIVIVTTGSLLATMRTVSHLWRQEKQARSVQEIARQSGFLYDKFVAFVEDLKTIGLRLDHARTAYDDAMHKLVNASRPGDTLIGKAEKIRELGARTTKTLPKELVDQSDEV